jgi:lipopolysaccharide/colanic/teichoic acid biosynthesis glycosyltransferase
MWARKGGALAPVLPVGGESWRHTSASAPSGLYPQLIKPVLDRVIGLLLLIVFSPVIAASALAVFVTMGRPVFYSQQRIGLGGRSFRLYKIRTMIPDRRVGEDLYSGAERRLVHKSMDDPRVTLVGKALRATRFDELPQFLNVVRGDMSMVGPRPELPEIVRRYEPWQHDRHLVKPGVTGPWQVSNHNGDLMYQHTGIDLEYLEQVSFTHDLGILVRTPMAMVGRKGH